MKEASAAQVILIAEILLCFRGHHAGESEQANKVGDRHQAVEGVGDIPRQGQLHGGADQQEDHEE